MNELFVKYPHRRYNPLTGTWILVSPHRTKRPWLGQTEASFPEIGKSYDPDCYLCPGNIRANGKKNLTYSKTFVFDNDFAALLDDVPVFRSDDELFRYESVEGTCRVICYTPDHSKTMALMQEEEIVDVIYTWIEQYSELIKKYKWVQIFENRGSMMGASNPHPHGQIWAMNKIPQLGELEYKNQFAYKEKKGSLLLLDYVKKELEFPEERVVLEGEYWVFVVPFWAVWPYETLLLPKFKVSRISDLIESQIKDLAKILKRMLIKYDNLFNTFFPYSMGWHNAPAGNEYDDFWTLHAHFYPPLLRSATIRKFMVGFEMLSEPQRDIIAEVAAQRLRSLDDVHFLKRSKN